MVKTRSMYKQKKSPLKQLTTTRTKRIRIKRDLSHRKSKLYMDALKKKKPLLHPRKNVYKAKTKYDLDDFFEKIPSPITLVKSPIRQRMTKKISPKKTTLNTYENAYNLDF